MTKYLIFLLLIMLTSSTVLAHGESDDLKTDFAFDEQNLIGKDLPRILRLLFGNQRINIDITLGSGENLVHGLVTRDGVITSLTARELKDPTLIVKTNEQHIKTILSSEKQLQEFQKALTDGRITYQAVGIGNKVKSKMVTVLSKLARWFLRE